MPKQFTESKIQPKFNPADKKRVSSALRQYSIKRRKLIDQMGFTDTKQQDRIVKSNVDALDVQRAINRINNTVNSMWSTRESRMAQWSHWSETNDKGRHIYMPRAYEQLAYALNEAVGHDKYDSYGYGVVYYAHVEGWGLKRAIKNVKADQFDGYRPMKRATPRRYA